MFKFAFFFTMFICAFVIYIIELAPKKIIYDCSIVTYPMAIDIPKEVIEQCRNKGVWNKK